MSRLGVTTWLALLVCLIAVATVVRGQGGGDDPNGGGGDGGRHGGGRRGGDGRRGGGNGERGGGRRGDDGGPRGGGWRRDGDRRRGPHGPPDIMRFVALNLECANQTCYPDGTMKGMIKSSWNQTTQEAFDACVKTTDTGSTTGCSSDNVFSVMMCLDRQGYMDDISNGLSNNKDLQKKITLEMIMCSMPTHFDDRRPPYRGGPNGRRPNGWGPPPPPPNGRSPPPPNGQDDGQPPNKGDQNNVPPPNSGDQGQK